MLGGKLYSEKIPKSVRLPLQQFSGTECLLIKRDIKSNGDSLANNCHVNVARHCENFPGTKSVNGWLLQNANKLISSGIWVWSFHSVCLRDDGELVDITESSYYAGKPFSTFWPDASRTADLISGTNYNNIVVFENQAMADVVGEAARLPLNTGEIYWTTRDLREYRRLNEHSGKYKWLLEKYAENIKQFEESNNVKLVDGKIVPSNPNSDVPNDIRFDWSAG